MLTDELYYGFSKNENSRHGKNNDVIHCLIVGMLIFCASAGCVLGLLSQFEVAANYPLILIILLISALFLALIHISRLFYIAGYFLFMFLFAYGLFTMRTYANSGYQALLNIINEAYSNHYLLSSVREYTEIIQDRYLTVTTVSIFLGVFLVLLLNVDIFNNMYYATAFFLTFLPLQLGIFIGRYPSYLSLAFLFFSYFGIFLIRHSCHFYFVQPAIRKKPREYSFDYYDKKGRLIIFHKSNAMSMLSICIFALCASLIFSIFTSSVISASENEAVLRKSSFKESLDENVKILTQTGIMGLFNRYEAKGGISGGKLGGVRSVAPDYETDLEVTFVPYSFETLYLKGYTSWLYTGSSWEAPSEGRRYLVSMPSSSGPSSRSDIAAERYLCESHALDLMAESGMTEEAHARMKVKNIDADTGYVYVPYFVSSLPDAVIVEPTSVIAGYSATDNERTYEFVPFSSERVNAVFENEERLAGLYDNGETIALSEYHNEVYSNYLQIPPQILDELMSYHDEIGTADNVRAQIDLIYKFFLDNYTYDMAPGATPYNKDFVTYFLSDQKRGYCAHFASAGALLLRSYGIPARYVEGYVVTASGITESGSASDEDTSYYYTGKNPLGTGTVVTTEVSDGNAHAWVEVFIDGFGWMPVDLTVPDTGSQGPSYADFLASLSRLLDPAYIPGSDEDAGGNGPAQNFDPSSFFNLNDFSAFNVFTGLILVLMLIPVFKWLLSAVRDLIKRRRSYKAGDYAPQVSYLYKRACKKLAKKYSARPSALTEDNFMLISRLIASGSKKGSRLNTLMSAAGVNAEDILLLSQTCFYGDKKISRPEADLLVRFYKII